MIFIMKCELVSTNADAIWTNTVSQWRFTDKTSVAMLCLSSKLRDMAAIEALPGTFNPC